MCSYSLGRALLHLHHLMLAVSIAEMRKSLAMPRTSMLSVAAPSAVGSTAGAGAGAGAGSRAAAGGSGAQGGSGGSNSLGALLQGFERSLLEELKQHLALLQARLAPLHRTFGRHVDILDLLLVLVLVLTLYTCVRASSCSCSSRRT